jgi:hypothetical protein
MHTLPDGFHRIRYYGFAANGRRSEKLALCRRLLDIEPPHDDGDGGELIEDIALPCPCCGGRMIIVEQFDALHDAARFNGS